MNWLFCVYNTEIVCEFELRDFIFDTKDFIETH